MFLIVLIIQIVFLYNYYVNVMMKKFVVYLYNARILQTVTNQHSLTKRLVVDRNATASRG